MSEPNKYFPHLFSPIQVGTKTIKNRIEAAPALFAFEHYIEADAFGYYPPMPERAFRMLKAKAEGGAGSVVLGELSPNHTYCKRFPFEPDIDFTSREDKVFQITKKTADMIKSYGALPIGELLSTGEIKTNIGDGINPKGPTEKDLDDGITHVDAFTKEEIKEHLKGGLEIEDAIKYCKMCEPYIDLIHVSCGHYLSSSRSQEFTTAYAPHGANIENAALVKQNVSVPVAVVGGINSPEQAEEAIASGKVNMVSLGRQFFADPAFPNKAAEGRADEIRRCLRCGRCYPGPSGEHETEKWTVKYPSLDSCTINPDTVWPASHYKVLPELMPKPTASRKVLIVGGGCGGLQAAITATDRGHKVILCEKAGVLGGIINFTDHTDHKVDIRLNCEVTPEVIAEIQPEAVILAVGSDDLILPINGIENAITAMEVYANDFKQLGKSTIVLGGGLVGCEAAADYIDHGVGVTIVEMKECLMLEVTGLYRTAVHDFIDKNGGKYEVGAKVVKVGKDFVVAQKQDGQEITVKADTVVNAMGRRAHSTAALKAAIQVPCWEIGDCVRARQIGDAVREGWTAAMEIV